MNLKKDKVISFTELGEKKSVIISSGDRSNEDVKRILNEVRPLWVGLTISEYTEKGDCFEEEQGRD